MYPQAQLHLRGGRANHYGPAAAASGAHQGQHSARLGQASFNNLELKPATVFEMAGVGRLEVKSKILIDQLAASVVGERDGESMAKKYAVGYTCAPNSPARSSSALASTKSPQAPIIPAPTAVSSVTIAR